MKNHHLSQARRFSLPEQCHKKSFRKPNQILLGPVRTSFYLRSFFYQSSLLWNTLPAELQCIKNNRTFKREIESYWKIINSTPWTTSLFDTPAATYNIILIYAIVNLVWLFIFHFSFLFFSFLHLFYDSFLVCNSFLSIPFSITCIFFISFSSRSGQETPFDQGNSSSWGILK